MVVEIKKNYQAHMNTVFFVIISVQEVKGDRND